MKAYMRLEIWRSSGKVVFQKNIVDFHIEVDSFEDKTYARVEYINKKNKSVKKKYIIHPEDDFYITSYVDRAGAI